MWIYCTKQNLFSFIRGDTKVANWGPEYSG
jgi:hypothetical protein